MLIVLTAIFECTNGITSIAANGEWWMDDYVYTNSDDFALNSWYNPSVWISDDLGSTQSSCTECGGVIWGWWITLYNSSSPYRNDQRHIARNFNCLSPSFVQISLTVYFCNENPNHQQIFYFNRMVDWGAASMKDQRIKYNSSYTNIGGSSTNKPGTTCNTDIRAVNISDTFTVTPTQWIYIGISQSPKNNTNNAMAFNNFKMKCAPISTESPTFSPTVTTTNPTSSPSKSPSNHPSKPPTNNPSYLPTKHPSINPSKYPSDNPSFNPSTNPTLSPTLMYSVAILSFPYTLNGTLYNKSFKTSSANFGYQPSDHMIKGLLVLPMNTSYHQQCNDGEPRNKNIYINYINNYNIDGQEFIMIIDRGNCSFVEKTQIAQSLGANGVIICDHTNEALFAMNPPISNWTDNITIPSVLLQKTNCQLLYKHIGVVNWNPNHNWNPNNIEQTIYPDENNMNWTIATIIWGTPNSTVSPTKYPTTAPTPSTTTITTTTTTATTALTSFVTTPSKQPSLSPTKDPTQIPTNMPTVSPTKHPTVFPTNNATQTPVPTTTLPTTQTPSKSPLALSQTYQPTSGPTTDPITAMPTSQEPSKSPLPLDKTHDPTLRSTADPTPSLLPTRSNPTTYPISTIHPTVLPTTMMPITSEPTTSPTSIYLNLYFFCRYNDEALSYYIISITLTQYAEIMINAILNTMNSITDHSTNYDDNDKWQYAAWNRAGILNLQICVVFDGTKLNDECSSYDIADTHDNDNEEEDDAAIYTAIGTFGIIVDKALNKYKEYLMEEMKSNSFKKTFSDKMNDGLNNAKKKLQQNRRRNLLDQDNNFEAVSIEIIDPFNTTTITSTKYHDLQNIEDSNKEYDVTVTLIIILVCLIGLIIIGTILYILYKQRKDKRIETNKEGQINEEIEMNQPHEMEIDNVNQHKYIKEENEGNSNDITGNDNNNDNDDDEIVAIINRTDDRNMDNDNNDDDVVNIINQTQCSLDNNDKKVIKGINQNWQQDNTNHDENDDAEIGDIQILSINNNDDNDVIGIVNKTSIHNQEGEILNTNTF